MRQHPHRARDRKRSHKYTIPRDPITGVPNVIGDLACPFDDGPPIIREESEEDLDEETIDNGMDVPQADPSSVRVSVSQI